MSDTSSGESHFLGHPEVAPVFEAMHDLLDESDRGAVLMSCHFVDEALGNAIKAIAPSGFPDKRLKELLSYPGPLSSLASRERVVVLFGLIPVELGDCFGQLRRLRNHVAHGSHGFRLRDHWDTIRKIFDMGPGVPYGINRLALEYLFRDALRAAAELKKPWSDSGEMMFDTPAAAIDYMKENPGVLSTVEERLPRLELCIGTAMLCGMLIVYRDRWIERRYPQS